MVYFYQIFDVFFSLIQPLYPLDQRRPLHMLYIYIATFNCPTGILGLGGKASKNKLKDANFIFSMTNVTNLESSTLQITKLNSKCLLIWSYGSYFQNQQKHCRGHPALPRLVVTTWEDYPSHLMPARHRCLASRTNLQIYNILLYGYGQIPTI